MSMKLHKPLNPEAEEYRQQAPPPPPHMPLLPHAIVRLQPLHHSAPPPPQAVVTVAPQLKLEPHFYHPWPCCCIPTHYTHCPRPIHANIPAHLYLPKAAAAAAAPPVCAGDTNAASPSSNTKQRRVKSPKCPRTDVFKRAQMRHFPPRIRKALRPRAPTTPPPPQKQVWRQKIAAKDSSPPTTLMIKNIPNQLRRDFMLKFLDGFCKIHSVAYDFFYLPIDFENTDNGNFGYAFVNFTTNAAAIKMKKVLDNYKWQGTCTEKGEFCYSRKICETRWARVQGKEALIRRFEMSKFKCRDVEFLPVVLDPPRNGSDPNPPAPVILGKLFPRSH